MTSQRERMLRGLPYDAADAELASARLRARKLMHAFNHAAPEDEAARSEALAGLLGLAGARLKIEPPFRCDYGANVRVGDDVYVNFNCVILDCAAVRIGNRVLIGPNVQILAATHPLQVSDRRTGLESALPVTIEDDVWLGAGVIVCPGVTIGAGAVVGAGSVVVRSVPPGVLAVGNPCRVLRVLTGGDR